MEWLNYHHLLYFWLVARYRRGFPASLDGAPMLLPGEGTALLKAFGQDGVGIFPAASAERRLKHPAVVAISTAARASFLRRPGG